MDALGVSGEGGSELLHSLLFAFVSVENPRSCSGCLERADLVRHLEGAPDVEVAPELSAEKKFRYDLQDLEQLDLPLLRNLMERHRVPFDLEEDLSEDDERRVALRSFADAGWMRGASKTPPKPSEGAKQMPARPENTTEPAQTTTAAFVPSTDAGESGESGESEMRSETPSGESCEAKSRAAGGLLQPHFPCRGF